MSPFDFRDLAGPFPDAHRNFEELCSMLMKAEFPRARVLSVSPPDAGIDFMVVHKGKKVAYQCKYFPVSYGKTQESQIVRSLRRAKAHRRELGWSRYVLCLPYNLTEPQMTKLVQIGRNERVPIDVLGQSDWLDLLIRYPHIKNVFFPTPSQLLSDALASILLIAGRPRTRREVSTDRSFFFQPPGKRLSRIFHAAADVLALDGNWPAAVSLLLDALTTSSTPTQFWDIKSSLAVIYGQQGKRSLAQSILAEVVNSAPREVAAFALVDQADLLCDQGSYRRAQMLLEKATELGRKFFFPEERARILMISGDIAFSQGDFRLAGLRYRRALSRAPRSLWLRGEISARLADVYRRLGRLRSALDAYREAEQILGTDGDLRLVAEVMVGQGMIMLQMGQLDLAEHYYRQALNLEDRVGHKRGKSVCWNNLALVALQREDCKLAEDYATKSLRLARSIEDKHGASYSWAVLGKTALQRGKMQRAKQCFSTARKVALAAPSRLGVALADLGIAEVLEREHKPKEAIGLCLRATRKLRLLNNPPEIAAAEAQLGRLYKELSQLSLARHYLTSSRRIFRRLGLTHRADEISVMLTGMRNVG